MRKLILIVIAFFSALAPVSSQGQMVLEQRFSKEAGAPIHGVAVSGIIVAGEKPIPGLRVELFNPQGKFISESHTDDAGAFYFQGLEELESPYEFKIFWGKGRLIAERQLVVFEGLKDIVLQLK